MNTILATIKNLLNILSEHKIQNRGILVKACLAGALVFFLEFVFCIVYTNSFSIMGVRSKALEDAVFVHFKWFIIFNQIKILIIYMCIGTFAGLAAGYVQYIYGILRNMEMPARRVIRNCMLSCIIISSILISGDILAHPALYNEHLYARGGVLKWIQVIITDYIPPDIFIFFRLLILFLFIPLFIRMAIVTGRVLILIRRIVPIYAVAILALILIVTLSVKAYVSDKNTGPNIIIIAADSFRYDRVSAWGKRKDLTPNIDALAREGTSFKDFHVQLPRTFPSWYCLLSGKYPAQHGIRHMFPAKSQIESAHVDLPEILKKNGYATSAVADYAGDIFSRMNCFDSVKAPVFNFRVLIKQRSLEIHFLLLPYLQNKIGRMLFPETKEFAQNSDPEFLKGDIIDELKSLSGKKKFFLSIFCSVTHFPYASPYPYYKKYAPDGYNGEFKYMKINDPTKNTTVTAADREQIIALFDGACSSADSLVGGIVKYLKENNLYDNSIIIFTADHGENLYDNNLDIGHGEHFRGEYATHVPFIIKFHKEYSKQVSVKNYDGIMEQVDFAPTLTNILGLKNAAQFTGVSFKRVIEGKSGNIPRIAYAETGIWFVNTGDQFFQRQRIMYPDVSALCEIEEPDYNVVLKKKYNGLINIAKHRTVFDDKYKMIYIPTRDGVQFELYRRGDGSFTNLYRKEHPEFIRLYRHLKDIMTRYDNAKIINGIFIPEMRGEDGT